MIALVDKTETVKISIYYAKDEKSKLVATANKDVLLKLTGLKEDSLDIIDFEFSLPNYKDDTDALSAAISSDGTNMKIDSAKYRYERLVLLLKKWNLKDAEGKDIKVSRENINSLQPVIAQAVVNRMEEVI